MSMSRSQNKLFRDRLNSSKNKVAYLTIGRWQPPHKGHAVLINKTLDLALQNNGHAYVYIYSKEPSRRDKWLADLSLEEFNKEVNDFKVKNPLNIGERLYYLQKMFPQREKFSPDVFEFLLGERQFFKRYTPTRKDIRGSFVSPHRHGTMSLELVNYLKKLKYSEVKIVVGSDRIAAFKKYNPNIDILQAGEERGGVGEGKLDVVDESADIGVVSFKLLKKNKFNSAVLRRLEQTLSDETLFDPQPRPAVEISGSRMREYARTNNTRKFVEGSAIGDMTYDDCLQLMQDVREGMKLELKIRPRIMDHIEIDPHDQSRGVIKKGSHAEKDTEFFRDVEKFQLRGGKKKLLKKFRKTKKKRLKKFRKTKRKRRRKKKVRQNTKNKSIRKIIKVRKTRKTRKNNKQKGGGSNMCSMFANDRKWLINYVKQQVKKNKMIPILDPHDNPVWMVTAKKVANDYCKEMNDKNFTCNMSGKCEKINVTNLSQRFQEIQSKN